MKSFYFAFLGLFLVLNVQAQQVLVQNKDLVIRQDAVTDIVYHNATVFVETDVSYNMQKGSIKLLLVNSKGEVMTTLETIPFSKNGECAFMLNEQEWLNYEAEYSKAKQKLYKITSEIDGLHRRKTVADYEKDEKLSSQLEKEIESYSEQEIMLRAEYFQGSTKLAETGIVKQVKKVEPQWVYYNTFDRLTSEYLDGYELNKKGLNALMSHAMYRGDDAKEYTFKVGSISDFFGIKRTK